jgi:hypothetical protein
LIEAHRSLSKQSNLSGDEWHEDDKADEDYDHTSAIDSAKKNKKCWRVPFIFKVLKLNAPEWPWILLGGFNSIVYGAIEPIVALFFAKIYALFAEPNLEEQKRLGNIYAAAIFLIGVVEGVSQF